ncbi:MAG: carbohydrate kinase [Candidatus Lokiarchaeota archaeon]|nr:carbohydrate kinase [Candidatus Lokiarchaeota archaeon]MBD3198749.1 carbohydrate kinase [Candidatus Lokiarchaeota archaeon]
MKILTFDLGTTGNKAAIFDENLKLIAKSKVDYPIYYPKKGWAEQDAEDYWKSMKETTSDLLKQTNSNPQEIKAIICDCQMNCTVPINSNGVPLMRCISWLDVRAAPTTKIFRKGLLKVSGFGVGKLLMFIKETGGAPGINGKDPISHILWIKNNNPEIYDETFKFLSVKDFVVYRCTNNAITSRDLANTSWLMNTDPEILDWSDKILKKFDIDKKKLPLIKKSTEIAGKLTDQAAQSLGLKSGIPVFVGSGDITSAAIGSGAISENKIHICLGTADWVAAHVSERKKDLMHYTGSICSAKDDYLCLSKQETGAACLDWMRDQIFIDECNEFEEDFDGLYSKLDFYVEESPPGAKNLLFAPWMYGERSPLNDPDVRGCFLNMSLDHTRADLLRAVYEGVAYNIKWSLEYIENLVGTTQMINIIGGGALSDIWCQILSDILDRDINKMKNPNLGSTRGSAIIALVGLGLFKDFKEAVEKLPIEKTFRPQQQYRSEYDMLYNEFLKIYKRNKKMFKELNA